MLQPGTKVFIPRLSDTPFDQLHAFCAYLVELGLRPVPHLTATSLRSHSQLDHELDALVSVGVQELMLIRGNVLLATSAFRTSLEVLDTGLFEQHGLQRVWFAGHPEGVPGVQGLEVALEAKRRSAQKRGLQVGYLTQFSFDVTKILAWIRNLRKRGDDTPVAVGVAGPNNVEKLFMYAQSCGVDSRGLDRTRPLYDPSGQIRELSKHDLGISGIHIFPFGGPVLAAG